VTPVDNVHLTLVFLGNVATERVAALSEIARECKPGSFELTFDRIERWHGGILSLVPSAPPATLLTLVKMLRARLSASKYTLEEREFRPHLTLARDALREARVGAVDALTWPVSEFCLVESTRGAHGSLYRTIASWPLA
jgi:2'-5' RNA ligase